MHGGAAGSGGSHNLKHGRYSKSLGKLASVYEASREDRNLFDLREPIAALDGVTKRMMELVDEDDSPEFRQTVKTKFDAVRRALRDGDPNSAQMLEDLGQFIDRGAAQGQNLETLATGLDKLARRIEGAWSIHLQKTQVMNKTDIVGLLAKFFSIVSQEAGHAAAARVQSRLLSAMSAGQSPVIAEVPHQEAGEANDAET